MGYIIDTYSRWNTWERTHQRHIFYMNDIAYAIYELDGTQPTYIDKEFNLNEYQVYKSLEAAKLFVREIKKLNS